MMRKCIMVRVGEAKEMGVWGKFINLAEIWWICNMHHWFRGDGRSCQEMLCSAFAGKL